MASIGFHSVAQIPKDFESDIRKTLDEIKRWAEDSRYGWISYVSADENIVRIAVGALHIFFREAYGFDRQGYIQYGYWTQDPVGAIATCVVAEWQFNYDSSYSYHLSQPDGIRPLMTAADKVLTAIIERHGEAARCRRGCVQVELASTSQLK
ncbi:MAG TPA: hypothetical protein VFY65_12735 [Longimicrobium sp.]|nr:hypothetical protein [Longimicrobium sp.]